tara:strand:- start:318 stop:1046 length:729 start_codon:yes stop_codon:yes gene_type:complete
MKKIKIFLITILFTFIYYGNAVAGTGEATEYKIKIYKIEMCDSTSTASACNNAVTIYDKTAGSGDIDIANTTAGAAAASLGNAGLASFGVNYTYMQITMSRAFTVKGSADDDSGTTCYTTSSQSGAAGTLAKGSADSADLGSTTLYAAMIGTSVGDNLTGLQNLTDTTGVASTIENNDEYIQYRQRLAKTFTLVAGNIPSIKIAFGTSAALGAIDDMEDDCETVGAAKGLYAAEPDVTVTIE